MAIVASQGKLNQLRVIELGSKHGHPSDQLDVEVVVSLDSEPEREMGFQLRDDRNRPVRQGMLALLLSGYTNDLSTRLEYDIDLDAGRKRGTIIRVILTK